MTPLKFSRVAAALTPVLAGMTLALNTHAVESDTKPTATPSLSAQHGQSTQAQQQMQDVRASRLIGTAVEGTDGKRLGEIEDLVIDLNNQRVQYAVLGYGGFAGIGEKLFAYPVSALQPAEEGRLRLNVSEQKLKDAPGFDRKNWPDWADQQYRDSVDQYYGQAQPVKTDEDPRYVRASDFIGMDIEDRSSQDIGEVEDLVVNMQDGTLHYVLVEFDDWHQANDDRLYALAPAAFRGDAIKDDDFHLNMDRQELASAPSITKDRLNNINDQQWTADVKRYLGSESGAESGAIGSQPQPGAATQGTPAGQVQADRTPESTGTLTGGDRASGTPPSTPQPAQ